MNLTIEHMRAFEALALMAPIKAETVETAKQLAKLLPLMADDSEEFAALTDFINAIAHGEKK